MPRHLISDAHDLMNEIPTVLVCYLATLQPREWAGDDQQAQKTFLVLTALRHDERIK